MWGSALDLFLELAAVPSPSGDERTVTDRVIGRLRELGLGVEEDDTGAEVGSNAGNLYARLEATNGGGVPLFFCAHLDTVPPEGPLQPVVEDGVVRNAGGTILGADNKAAVTVLLEMAARHASDPPPVGLELVFTVAEEDGLRGAKALDVDSLRADAGFVIDHATPIGEVIVAAPTYKRLVATFEGHEAHAGINPEEGHSAIAAAAGAVAQMKLGRLDEETTANVGVIEGGTASNVVAGHCRLLGEARSVDGERAAAVIGEMVDACTWAAGEGGCDLDVEVSEMFKGYRMPKDSPTVAAATRALERCGHEVKLTATGGGSDANALRARGFDCVLLANGTEANHTPEESVSAANIVAMYDVCAAVADEAAAACRTAAAPSAEGE